MNKVELLAPVGNREAFFLAINHGADAVYFGGKQFGARAFASNFSNEEIADMIAYAHQVDVCVYITINTIIKPAEWDEVIDFIDFLVSHHVDAVIVQDIGLIYYLRQVYPDLSLHASTQMNIHSAEQAFFLASLGVKRVVMARETPLSEIKKITETNKIEVEVFVHGALCVSYSGNCYFSSLVGKRSGNRGRCAQPCRLPYEIDGLTSSEYILSPKDLMTIDYLQDIVAAGVHSLKIEGRMKKSEYVGLIVNKYRQALQTMGSEQDKKEIEQVFNREFTKGFLLEETNQAFTNTNASNHQGIVIGKVIAADFNKATILLTDNLSYQDSIRIGEEDAIIINEMRIKGQNQKQAKAGDIITIRTHQLVKVSSPVRKITDAMLEERIRTVKRKQIAIEGTLSIQHNRYFLEITDGTNTVHVLSFQQAEPARTADLAVRVQSQLEKTKDTNYYFTKLDIAIEGYFLPVKDINELRRQAIQLLDEKRTLRPHLKKESFSYPVPKWENQSLIMVKVRTMPQLQQALALEVPTVIVEEEQYLSYQNNKTQIILSSPRIQISLKETTMIQHVGTRTDKAIISGIYMNITNAYGISFLHEQGINLVGLSLELSKEEIKQVINQYQMLFHQLPNLYTMVYGYYDMMILKHCPINKALGYQNLHCRACYEKQYYLKDRLGYRFPLIDDGNCHLRVLNSKRVHLLSYLSTLKEIGIKNILLDFTIEQDIKEIIVAYQQNWNQKPYELELDEVTIGHFKEGVM